MALTATHKRRIRKLAAYLRDNVTPEHFDMSWWWRNHQTGKRIYANDRVGPRFGKKRAAEALANDCGTAACVAGWAALLWPEEIGLENYGIGGRAGEFLGLGEKAADALFAPMRYEFNAGYTVERAVETLERLAATGKVQWFKEHKPVESDASY